ncbi:uncharacterized protein JCM6883_002527 [Sporobolomyces salmoneus]|uniref:uncharacterized protein n=1 Tax=Sporobolomyces salmoneus TaxID=183962 RepID=UPI00316DB6F6
MPKFSNANWPTIWGFDLSELSFSAFSSKKMFDKKWHLRRERFIAYQAAMLICLAAECTATYSLAKYEDTQDRVEDRFAPAHYYQNDLVDFAITTIVFSVFVATLFGADFFFLLQFPKRRYPDWYQNTKKFCAIVITTGVFAAALGSTIVVARNSAQIVHVSEEVAREAAEYYFRPPLVYRKWAVNLAWVVLLWIGWLACVVSTILMFMASSWDKANPSAFNTSHISSGSTENLDVLPTSVQQSGQSSLDLGHRPPVTGEKLSATPSTNSQAPPLEHTVL